MTQRTSNWRNEVQGVRKVPAVSATSRHSALKDMSAALLLTPCTAFVSQPEPSLHVRVLGQGLCPDCNAAVNGPLAVLVDRAPALDLEYVAFGNAFFSIDACGSPTTFSHESRGCWARACVGVAEPVADCFSGRVIVQHAGEREVDTLSNCAKARLGRWKPYYEYLRCTFGAIPYLPNRTKDESFWMELKDAVLDAAPGCASSVGLEFEDLLGCAEGEEGSRLYVEAAKQTEDHAFVPDVRVGGKKVRWNRLFAGEEKALCYDFESMHGVTELATDRFVDGGGPCESTCATQAYFDPSLLDAQACTGLAALVFG